MCQPMEVGGRPRHLRQFSVSAAAFPQEERRAQYTQIQVLHLPLAPDVSEGPCRSPLLSSPLLSSPLLPSSPLLSSPLLPSPPLSSPPLRVMGLLLSLILLLLRRLPSLGFSYRKTLSRTRAPQWLQIYPCLIDIATVSCRAVPQTETEDLSLLKGGEKNKTRKWCVWSRLSGFEVLSGPPRCRGTWEWKRWTKGLLCAICLLAIVH